MIMFTIMSFESPRNNTQRNEHHPTFTGDFSKHTQEIATHLRESVIAKTEAGTALEEIEDDLNQNGFILGNTSTVSEVFSNPNLLCRSESFSKVMDLLLEGKTITITGNDEEANMCRIASGQGFRIAITEGFSGKDVLGALKVVLTFKGEHLNSKKQIPPSKELWQLKPRTAEVSLTGEGDITTDDIEMISIRFPISIFPHQKLSEEEQDLLADEKIKFIVRHYVVDKKKTLH